MLALYLDKHKQSLYNHFIHRKKSILLNANTKYIYKYRWLVGFPKANAINAKYKYKYKMQIQIQMVGELQAAFRQVAARSFSKYGADNWQNWQLSPLCKYKYKYKSTNMKTNQQIQNNNINTNTVSPNTAPTTGRTGN